MSAIFKRVSGFLRSRLFRNVVLWLFVLLQLLDNGHYQYNRVWYYLFIAISVGYIMAAVYVNNLYLLPTYFRNKKFLKYFSFLLLFDIVLSVSYTVIVKDILIHFPLVKLKDITPLAISVSPDWGGASLCTNSLAYLLGYTIVQFLFTMAWFMNNYSKQEKNIAQIERKQIETELNFLKSQINPHFLFNNLNNLYALSIKKSDQTPDAILKLSSLLRYMLYESNVDMIAFSKEQEVMQAYIDLELLRLNNREHLSFVIAFDEDHHIPPLLWMPVLENVFKYGTRIISNDYFIEFKFAIENGVLYLYSKNTYKSNFGKSSQEKVGGIGTANLRKRLALLYPNKHQIDLLQDEKYYTADIKVWLK